MAKLATKKYEELGKWDVKQSDYIFIKREQRDEVIKSYVEANKEEKDKWYLTADNEFFFTICRVFNRKLYKYSFEYED